MPETQHVDWRKLPRKPRPDLAERNKNCARHGLSGSGTRKSWEAMIRRCTLLSDKDFVNYGGRGIEVCERWRNSFTDFVADMGIRPAGTSLGRVDNDGPYALANCRWETAIEQTNNRRSSRMLTVRGQTMTIAQWARMTGLSHAVLSYRIKVGWRPADAISTPVNHANRRTLSCP